MAIKHYTIPFFILHKGCPFQCIFCDQNKITGEGLPDPLSVPEKIEKYLATMPSDGAHVEVGFFGGSFTGLATEDQEKYLSPVRPFIEERRIDGIRLSTRPDMIDEAKAAFLVANKVSCVELGVQSMSDKVLLAAKRGHTAEDTVRASKIIRESGIELGHQMMVGLPSSTFGDELYTAECAKNSGASQMRIYPVLVIKDTMLAEMWKNGEYSPLSEEEAVDRSAKLIKYFETNNIKVIRCGLHPSEGLISGEEYLAGPFNPRFGQIARERAKKI